MNEDKPNVEELLRRKEAERKRLEAVVDKFLAEKTPAIISQELNEYVLGQPELCDAVADFIYYHALRIKHNNLPQRNILISGPSGSGKTEVFRRVKELYGEIFNFVLGDGSRVSVEGFKGNIKIGTIARLLTPTSILVLDEFDKLCYPRYTQNDGNVSNEIQGELLKLSEGEFNPDPRIRNGERLCANISIAYIGAFSDILKNKEIKTNKSIGFGNVNSSAEESEVDKNISFEELIEFGVIPELVGRIGQVITVNELTDADYLKIVKNQHSRANKLAKVLKEYNIDVWKAITDDFIIETIKRSKSNKTGVRWVSSMIENEMFKLIRDCGISQQKQQSKPSLFDREF